MCGIPNLGEEMCAMALSETERVVPPDGVSRAYGFKVRHSGQQLGSSVWPRGVRDSRNVAFWVRQWPLAPKCDSAGQMRNVRWKFSDGGRGLKEIQRRPCARVVDANG